jgi:hypothetical protein
MAYTAEYDVDDLDDIVIDIIAKYGVQLGAFAGILALVAIVGWLVAKFRSTRVL